MFTFLLMNTSLRLRFLILISFIAFISLGLPDGLLGIAWPFISEKLAIPLDNLGVLLMFFVAGYLSSSLTNSKIMSKISLGWLLAFSCFFYRGKPFWICCFQSMGFSDFVSLLFRLRRRSHRHLAQHLRVCQFQSQCGQLASCFLWNRCHLRPLDPDLVLYHGTYLEIGLFPCWIHPNFPWHPFLTYL